MDFCANISLNVFLLRIKNILHVMTMSNLHVKFHKLWANPFAKSTNSVLSITQPYGVASKRRLILLRNYYLQLSNELDDVRTCFYAYRKLVGVTIVHDVLLKFENRSIKYFKNLIKNTSHGTNYDGANIFNEHAKIKMKVVISFTFFSVWYGTITDHGLLGPYLPQNRKGL